MTQDHGYKLYRPKIFNLRNIAILAVIGGLLWYSQVYNNPTKNRELLTQAQQTILPQIRVVNAQMIAAALQQSDAVTFIFVYNSKNILSRYYFNQANKIAGRFSDEGLRTFAISTDADARELAVFLLQKDKLNFVPLILSPGQESLLSPVLSRALRSSGSSFNGEVPYFAAIGKRGISREFSMSFVRMYNLEDFINDQYRSDKYFQQVN